LDGWFLAFTELNAEALCQVILSSRTDDDVLVWVQNHARPTTDLEKQAWATEIDRYRPDTELVEYRKRLDPEVAEQVDVESLGVLDLVDILDN
jgi:uncharacterized protein (DUF2336 family)